MFSLSPSLFSDSQNLLVRFLASSHVWHPLATPHSQGSKDASFFVCPQLRFLLSDF